MPLAGHDQQLEILVPPSPTRSPPAWCWPGPRSCPFRPPSAAACRCSLWRVRHARTARVAVIHRPAHPLLVPPDLVHAIVVAAANPPRPPGKNRRDPAARAARPARPPTCRKCPRATSPWPGYFLAAARSHKMRSGKPGVAQVLPADIVKLLRAVRRAHAVHLHHDEPVVPPAAAADRWRGNSSGVKESCGPA